MAVARIKRTLFLRISMRRDPMEEKRIPELDLLRGIAVIGMILVHFFYDLEYFGKTSLVLPKWLDMAGKYGHLIFILISGICATLGHRTFHRGRLLFACGLLVSYVTLYMEYILDFQKIGIWFGILHLLGLSMMLYPLFRDFYAWELCFLSLFLICAGLIFRRFTVEKTWLFPFGLCSEKQYPGSDFFPLLPYFGWFLLGSAAGKWLYSERRSRLSWISRENRISGFFQRVGQNSLLIYLIHQPVLMGITLILKKTGAL